jgi:hypothetical protein
VFSSSGEGREAPTLLDPCCSVTEVRIQQSCLPSSPEDGNRDSV